jgi:hypothetical protein
MIRAEATRLGVPERERRRYVRVLIEGQHGTRRQGVMDENRDRKPAQWRQRGLHHFVDQTFDAITKADAEAAQRLARAGVQRAVILQAPGYSTPGTRPRLILKPSRVRAAPAAADMEPISRDQV